MSLHSRYMLAAVMGLWMAHPLPAQEPARLSVERGGGIAPQTQPSPNQEIADRIAAQLRQNGELHGYRIDVAVANGVAELNGSVADASQREEALRVAHAVSGVSRIVDHLSVRNGSGITLVQETKPPAVEQGPPPRRSTPMTPPGVPVLANEPQPVFQAPSPSPYDLNPPSMPPHAWPTYAPYNNYSRVAYPTAYPYCAWPFIGPMYPFPKVPLGWRSVKLEYEDCHWWFKKTATKHDWWRVKYW